MKKVHLLPDDIYFSIKTGALVSDALQAAGISITYPCGKKGTCARCLVYVDDKPVKACVTKIDRDMEIYIPESVKTHGQKVLTDISLYSKEENVLPLVEKVFVSLETPTLDDSVSDASRLLRELSNLTGINEASINIEPYVLAKLPQELRENGFEINVVIFYDKNGITVIDISDSIYGVAIDVGTTTMALALCDLETGDVLETVGVPNPQAEYGSDVISRIIYTEEHKDGVFELRQAVIDSLKDSIGKLAKKRNLSLFDISVITIASNTVMSHFLMGLKTDYLRREPYVPVVNNYPVVYPHELNMPILKSGRVIMLPSVSSYVGGDIVAGVIATKIAEKDGVNLLVDVGTNGEMVLSGEGFMIACSCSAGPAFEGSGISCGSRAIEGAINNVEYKDGELVFDVIGGDIMPTSVCGSGLISLISALLNAGIINRQGKFTSGDKLYHITELMAIEESDILNLIRAKGAIFAGMRVMLNNMEMNLNDLDHIYIAGGFGKSLNVENTVNIGMLPMLRDKNAYTYIGNASLVGALRTLNDRTIDLEETAASIINLELSIGNEFMDEFMKACFLPHTELSFFSN